MTQCQNSSQETQLIAFKKEESMCKLKKDFKDHDHGIPVSGFQVDLNLTDAVKESELLEELNELQALPEHEWKKRCDAKTSHFKPVIRDGKTSLCCSQ